MIQVENLSKSYGDVHAVRGVSFEVAGGEIYGLLGPNGAGKTTILSMMAGLLAPDEGRIRYDGVDLAEHPLAVKATLGVVPQENALYEDLSAREHLRLWGGLYGLSGAELDAAVDRVLDEVGLAGRARDPVKKYSGGMKRRLNLGMGLVHGPRIVLLDEPTVGIDPQARLNILDVVRGVAAASSPAAVRANPSAARVVTRTGCAPASAICSGIVGQPGVWVITSSPGPKSARAA